MSSTYFNLQRSAVLSLDPSAIIIIAPDNLSMKIKNISVQTLINLPFLVNNPMYDGYFGISSIEIFIDTALSPTKILGFSDIIDARIKSEDSLAFILGKKICYPFKNGFQNNLPVNNLVILLSGLTLESYTLSYSNKQTYTINLMKM